MITEDLLPDLPSELLEVALRDLEAVEQDDRYVVEMWDLHKPRDGKCYVCLAGATLGKSYNLGFSEDVLISELPERLSNKILCIDAFRRGNITSGVEYLSKPRFANVDIAKKIKKAAIDKYIPYHLSPSTFKAYIRSLIIELKKYNL